MAEIQIHFDEKGLAPVVVQDVNDRQVLMVAWMNREAFERTIQTGRLHFWSRSRKEIWLKGTTSGNYLFLKELFIDSDEDTVLGLVAPAGPACHTGERSCFYRQIYPEKKI